MTSAVDKMKEHSRQWAAQLPRIHGPSLKKPRRNASSKGRWSQTYRSMAKGLP